MSCKITIRSKSITFNSRSSFRRRIPIVIFIGICSILTITFVNECVATFLSVTYRTTVLRFYAIVRFYIQIHITLPIYPVACSHCLCFFILIFCLSVECVGVRGTLLSVHELLQFQTKLCSNRQHQYHGYGCWSDNINVWAR